MIDWDFIQELEGFETRGYVPNPKGSNSGVTIASGFDLGQRKAHALRRMGLEHLADKFQPYFGLKGMEAKLFLDDHPLEISIEDARLLNEKSHGRTVELVRAWWASEGYCPWIALPDACKTILASVAFQYGNLPRRTPTFWGFATIGDWQGVMEELRNFGDAYPTRRHKEADYLEARL